MGDLADGVRAAGTGTTGSKRKTIHRREAFKGVRIFMPRVLSKHPAKDQWRPFDYERDLLPRLDWESFTFRDADQFVPDDQETISRSQVRIDVSDLERDDPALAEVSESDLVDTAVDIPALSRLILDIVPNPWQGARIIQDALERLAARDISPSRIFTNRLFMMNAIKEDLKKQIHDAGESMFRDLLASGDLSFQLVSKDDPALNWELAETLTLDVSEDDRVQLRKDGTRLEKNLFEPVYQKEINVLERDVAWYLDADKAVSWWHRISVKQDWHLQGWQRNRIYPDFLVCVSGNGDGAIKFRVLETKGLHLLGNEDTEYKRRLFELLTRHSEQTESIGNVLLDHGKQRLKFEMLLESDWRGRMSDILN